MKIITWNVNGMRAAIKNGFETFLKKAKPDIFGLQEIKMDNKARERQEFDFADYEEYWHPADRPGYSGTAILTRYKPLDYWTGMTGGKDAEGRVQTMEFDQFYLVNAYFPNSNHELTRLPYKLKFDEDFLMYVKKLEKKKPVILCGDFNVAHREIDLARPKDNVGNPGFTDEERAWTDKLIKAGFVDTFRLINKDKIQYSWWSYRPGVRDRNIGWRIDYFFVSKALKNKVKDAFILDEVYGSDHCPTGVVIDI